MDFHAGSKLASTLFWSYHFTVSKDADHLGVCVECCRKFVGGVSL
jgi:hypothetical protein